MIEINLLPPEAKATPKTAPGFNPAHVVYAIPVVFALLIAAHIFLGISYILKSQQLRGLDKAWSRLEAQRKTVENFKREYNICRKKQRTFRRL